MTSSSLGFLLLGIWLLMSGTMSITGMSFSHSSTVLAVLMIASGALIVLGSRGSARSWWSR